MIPDTHEEDQILLSIHDSDIGLAHDGSNFSVISV